MKRLNVVLALLVFFSINLQAQIPIFKVYPKQLSPQDIQLIQDELQTTDFEVVNILTPSLKRYMKDSGGNGAFILEIGTRQWTIEFEEYDVRSANFVAMAHTSNGIVVSEREEVRGYRGSIAELPGSSFKFINEGNNL
ncbi:MAG: hypothetical protein AAF806_13420 [Bacteroidota bacterium]